MIRSMTGFGSSTREKNGVHFSLEIRSLNSRYFKSQVRLPEQIQPLEAELDARVTARMQRGSIVVAARYTNSPGVDDGSVNSTLIQRYLDSLRGVVGLDPDTITVDAGTLLSLPGVIGHNNSTEPVEEARPVLLDMLEEACDKLVAMREQEGRVLEQDLRTHCRDVSEQLTHIEKRAPALVQAYQEKLKQRISSLLDGINQVADGDDILREVAVFAERSDIAEECARLHAHVMQFTGLLDGDGAKPVGRTFDFIAQEMLREANTIASKCLDIDVSRRIVTIKGSIDRIKEQVQNVE